MAKTELAALLTALSHSGLGAGLAHQQDLPLTGSVSAKGGAGRDYGFPAATARLGSERLGYGKLNLGSLSGTLKLAGNMLSAVDVKLSGGEAPVRLAGSLDTGTQTGRFSLSTGALSIAEALDLAARLGNDAKPAKLDAQGMIALSADAALNSGKLTSTLSLHSERLTLSGQVLTGVDVSGSFAAQA